MNKAKNIEQSEHTLQPTKVKISFQCPICDQSAHLDLGTHLFQKSDNLTTISVPKGLICNHCFQAFVDKNYKIRGYQKVDFELNHDQVPERIINYEGKEFNMRKEKGEKQNKDIDFDKLGLNKNEIIYFPKTLEKCKGSKKATLKAIYEDFWEFISNDNKMFRKYIKNDKRRIHFVS